MPENDPKGYYAALGLEYGASSSQIKSAFREIAKELHPDLNKDRDTTADFQFVNEAYSVLSDDNLRAHYDALGALPESDVQNTNKLFEPIVCSKCGCVSAQPRYKVYYLVFSYIYGSYKKPFNGIYCNKCELKVSIPVSLATILFGWWGIYGFFWTLHAVASNLFGGWNDEVNARLQAHQAIYFDQQGKKDLAMAAAAKAIELIEKIKNNKDEDLIHLKVILENYINNFGVKNFKKFEVIDGYKGRSFRYTLIMYVACVAIISAISYKINLDDRERETVRLQQAGIAKADAERIAAAEQAELKKLEQPLPHSGVQSSLLGKPKGDWPSFKIENAPESNVLIKLTNVKNGVETMKIFVRGGETIEVKVPIGEYKVKLASGENWYGDKVRFGPKTNYALFDGTFTFRVKGDQLEGHFIKLQPIVHGNLTRQSLEAKDF